jgi:hypothetical protein
MKFVVNFFICMVVGGIVCMPALLWIIPNHPWYVSASIFLTGFFVASGIMFYINAINDYIELRGVTW